jgi:hypothetical protein
MLELISEAEFAAVRRDPLLGYREYQTEALDLIARIPRAGMKLGDPAWRAGRDEAALMRLTYARALYALDLLGLSYSAGMPVAALRDFYPALLGYSEEYALYSESFNATPRGARWPGAHLPLGDAGFNRANRLLCFAILLGWQHDIPRVMAIIDYNNPVRDGMLERIASIHMQRPAPLPSECTRQLPYCKTLAIVDASPADRPERMREYLDHWYEASRYEPYYDSHARGNQFLGYWSWEAAALTVALRIDDASYRDHAYYPRDMADCSRQIQHQKPQMHQRQ